MIKTNPAVTLNKQIPAILQKHYYQRVQIKKSANFIITCKRNFKRKIILIIQAKEMENKYKKLIFFAHLIIIKGNQKLSKIYVPSSRVPRSLCRSQIVPKGTRRHDIVLQTYHCEC